MELTAELREKIKDKIGIFEDERKVIESKLKERREFNRDAWREYGSELCAGSMIDAEKLLEEELSGKEKDIQTLNSILSGDIEKIDPDQIGRLRSAAGNITTSIKTMEKDRETIETAIKEASRARSLLGLPIV